MNTAEMSMMREFMREVGAVAEPNQRRAFEGADASLAPDDLSVPMSKFTSNSNWHVTPEECRSIASRLRAGMSVVQDTASFYDDAPPPAELERWVLSWVDFNERAVDHGGYRVR